MLNFDMVASPNAGWFVYDGDASDTASTGSSGSGVVEDVFVDFFDSIGRVIKPTAFDGRSDYDAFVAAGIPPVAFSPAPKISRRPTRSRSGVAPRGSPTTRATTRPATTSTISISSRSMRWQTRRPWPADLRQHDLRRGGHRQGQRIARLRSELQGPQGHPLARTRIARSTKAPGHVTGGLRVSAMLSGSHGGPASRVESVGGASVAADEP